VLAFGDLHEQTCYIEAHIFANARQILTNLELLLATFPTELLISERFSHFEKGSQAKMMEMTARKIAHIDMDAFYASCDSGRLRNSAESRRCHFAQLRV
jgi:hypothetical protein